MEEDQPIDIGNDLYGSFLPPEEGEVVVVRIHVTPEVIDLDVFAELEEVKEVASSR